MRFMNTAEGPTDPVGELVSAEQSLGLDYLPLAMNPLGLYGVESRTLGGQQTRHYPHPAAAAFDLVVVGGDPASHLMALMPACVVPNKEQGLLAPLLELLGTPPKKLRGYSAHRTAIDEPQPGFSHLRADTFRSRRGPSARVILSRLLLQKTHRLCGIRPRSHGCHYSASHDTCSECALDR